MSHPAAGPSHNPPPQTPHRQNPARKHISSPADKVARFYAEHRRNEFQAYEFDEEIHEPKSLSSPEFLEFLDPNSSIKSKSPKTGLLHSLSNFIEDANVLAKAIKGQHFSNSPLLVFKDTGAKVLTGHVTDTKCKPDYTAAFENRWTDEGETLWPCTLLAGENGSKGKPQKAQKEQAISYLHYLLLARPDLYVAQGLLATEKSLMLLIGIGGFGIRSWEVSWGSRGLVKAMYFFIYRLYDPGHFADPSYVAKVDFAKEIVTYDVKIEEAAEEGRTRRLSNFRHVYGSTPFQTRTHVFVNPRSKTFINGEPLTVIKDQLCKVGRRFDEREIIDHIHEEGTVPGVVEAVYHKKIKIAESLLHGYREKHRMGLKQTGMPFMYIETLQEMLEVIYDIIENLRYLYSQRGVLHRDISKGNVMFFPRDSSNSLGKDEEEEKDEDKEQEKDEDEDDGKGKGKGRADEVASQCFVRHLLGESGDPLETSTLLVDFNRAEDTNSKTDPEHPRIDRTGTPLFIARAVEMGKFLPFPKDGIFAAEIPDSSKVYADRHPERNAKLPAETIKFFSGPPTDPTREWRHELNHDVESVFWLFFYWAIAAQPAAQPKDSLMEKIPTATWAGFIGKAEDRTALIRALRSGPRRGIFHSLYQEHLSPLVKSLASIIDFDSSWVPPSDSRRDPEYMAEAFQRLILEFLLANKGPGHDFMNQPVATGSRLVEKVPLATSLSRHSGYTANAGNVKKRAPPPTQPRPAERRAKRRRRNPEAEGQTATRRSARLRKTQRDT